MLYDDLLDEDQLVSMTDEEAHDAKKEYDLTGEMDLGESESVTISDQDLLPQLAEFSGRKNAYNERVFIGSTNDFNDAMTLFKFAAQKSNAEWIVDAYKHNSGEKYVIGTTHSGDHSLRTDKPYFDNRLEDQVFSIHSHPNTDQKVSKPDKGMYTQKYNKLNKNNDGPVIMPGRHYVYNVWHDKLYKFDSWNGDTSK